jgi:hypothetical protein
VRRRMAAHCPCKNHHRKKWTTNRNADEHE